MPRVALNALVADLPADAIINASARRHLTDILSCENCTSPEGFTRRVRDYLDPIDADRRELTRA
jgi:hypothetical protein